jgi:ribosome recycling factor
MISPYVKTLEPKFKDAISHLEGELRSLHSGRANSALVENLLVSYYGTQTPLKQMASISTPSPSTIQIQPWDVNSLGDIENAVRNSDLGLSPTNDGRTVRVSLPPMTEERRSELMKIVRTRAEETNISLRTSRGEAWEDIQTKERNGEITEDDKFAAKKEFDKLTEQYEEKIKDLVRNKEKEIMAI